MEIKNTRRYEAILVAAAFVIYVGQQLFNISDQREIAMQVIQNANMLNNNVRTDTSNYPHIEHFILPIVGGAILLLGAWLIFHLIVCQRVVLNKLDNTTLLSAGLSFLLVFLSLFLFHGLMQYIRFNHNEYGQIIGLRMISLYRKKTVLGDAIGIGFLFVFFELVSSVFRWVQRLFMGEKENYFSILAYIVPFIPAAGLFYFALDTSLPTPLWSSDMRNILLWISSIVVVWALQEYIVRFVLPNYKATKKVLLRYLFVFIAIWLLGNALILWAYSGFYFYYRFPFLFSLRSFLVQLICTLFPAIVFAIFRKGVLKEKIVLEQQVADTSAELAQLRSQINPHFLFNALNSLYAAAMKESAEKTADGIQRLGDMMRFMLQENNQERIPVEKEIEYLHNYIHLQRIRIDETQGIDIKVVLNQPDNNIYIAPMMLIPFVENAFKHGISHRSPSWIFITLSFDATHLYFRVQNSRHMRKETDPEEYQSGIGLQNVRKRLDLLYPGRHTLQIQESDHDYIASLTLSLW